jgi:predicted SPOUT superfamily RNA methylase MTH1
VSIALPGSVLDNAQTGELRTYLAGQIARAAAIFSIDEIVVFDDGAGHREAQSGSEQLARILQYLECPQYLRKHFFPLHADLQYAGVLNPTDMPHHLRCDIFLKLRSFHFLAKLDKVNCVGAETLKHY